MDSKTMWHQAGSSTDGRRKLDFSRKEVNTQGRYSASGDHFIMSINIESL